MTQELIQHNLQRSLYSYSSSSGLEQIKVRVVSKDNLLLATHLMARKYLIGWKTKMLSKLQSLEEILVSMQNEIYSLIDKWEKEGIVLLIYSAVVIQRDSNLSVVVVSLAPDLLFCFQNLGYKVELNY